MGVMVTHGIIKKFISIALVGCDFIGMHVNLYVVHVYLKNLPRFLITCGIQLVTTKVAHKVKSMTLPCD